MGKYKQMLYMMADADRRKEINKVIPQNPKLTEQRYNIGYAIVTLIANNKIMRKK